MKYSFKELILYISLRLAAVFFQVMPIGLALFIGRAIGRLGYLLDSKHTGIAYRNLRLAFSDKYSIPQLKALLMKNYENFGMNIVETLRLSGINQGYIKRYIKIKGEESLDNALRNKKGAIILGSHFGSWEISFTMAGIL
ncbi:MAG: hypothetical protein KKH80_01700, partial [Candidatus Omnitrophica bacterium]|nr:hypothetical protein [Candidatus Omnitrophota bacterium]